MVRGSRRVGIAGLLVVATVVCLYILLPRVAGLQATWRRIDQGDPWWLALACAFEALSFAGYVVLLRAVCATEPDQLGWRASYEITLAGVAATRLIAAAGAGGIALTAWALRGLGMDARTVVRRVTALLVLLYAVYAGAVVVVGLALRVGAVPGSAPFGITVVPALVAAALIGLALIASRAPTGTEARLRAVARRGTELGWATRIALVPPLLADGIRDAIALVQLRRPGLLGAVAWWAFDIATLWACFRAFGGTPEIGPLVMAYFVGATANVLPLPGGVGGVEGGMIAMLIAFGVAGGLAIVAVLTYRAFSFWIPTVPGTVAYLGLRRRIREPSADGRGGDR